MKVGIVGTGYVGLVTGVCLAAKGHNVLCADNNQNLIKTLNDGNPHIFEKGLPELLREVHSSGRFWATTVIEKVLYEVEIIIIAVGTPSVDGAIDLSSVLDVSRNIGAYLKGEERHISVVVKSTVVPGTTDTLVRREIEKVSGKRFPAFGLGMNPEFLREGNAIQDFTHPDRIVLGYEDENTLARLQELYAPWRVDKVFVNTRTAEMIKYTNNFLLATQISAVNEIANLAAALGGIDVMNVLEGVHLDKRWNPILNDGSRAAPEILTYLVPGCGFGGSCFPKDVQALRSQGEQHQLPMHIMNAVLAVNDAQPNQVIAMLEWDIPDLSGKQILLLGLAFKPGTDDIRESASIKIVKELLKKGAKVSAHDPVAVNNFKVAVREIADQICFTDRWDSHVDEADAIIIVTSWPEYFALSEHDLTGRIVFDARRMFKPEQLAGCTYRAIGLGPSLNMGDSI